MKNQAMENNTLGKKQHWDKVYSTKAPDSVSWFQQHAEQSLNLINAAAATKSAAIIDIGGGASTLVDDLLVSGYSALTVLDISGVALSTAKKRIGQGCSEVQWIEADVTKASLSSQAYDVWHDRAVFHFLTLPEDRHAYVKAVIHAVKSEGHVIVATFADDGPEQCSGLPALRYSPEKLFAEFGSSFEMIKHVKEQHITPLGNIQRFTYCYFRKK